MQNTLKGKNIESLFNNGKWQNSKNIKAVWSKSNDPKYLVSAPIKKFKKAVDRNKIKRHLRKAIQEIGLPNIHIAFIYSNDTIIDYNLIKDDISLILNNINI